MIGLDDLFGSPFFFGFSLSKKSPGIDLDLDSAKKNLVWMFANNENLRGIKLKVKCNGSHLLKNKIFLIFGPLFPFFFNSTIIIYSQLHNLVYS